MAETGTVFKVDEKDNVAVALTEIKAGTEAGVLGESDIASVRAVTDIPVGHKIALRDIAAEEDIIKYGVVIGRSTAEIPKGSWVHLHVMRSLYDERSSHLDVKTGAPTDTSYN